MSKQKRTEPYCKWTEDEDGNWDTGCDNKHCFIADGPRENGYKFCCYCGSPIKVKAWRLS